MTFSAPAQKPVKPVRLENLASQNCYRMSVQPGLGLFLDFCTSEYYLFFMFEEAKHLRSYTRPMVFSFDRMIRNISISEWAVMLTNVMNHVVCLRHYINLHRPLGTPNFC